MPVAGRKSKTHRLKPVLQNPSLTNVIEEFSRALVMFKPFFFGAKFGGVRLESTCSGAQGMFHMEHLVIEDQFDRVGRHLRAIQATVHHDLIE